VRCVAGDAGDRVPKMRGRRMITRRYEISLDISQRAELLELAKKC
jgi:hypothetical protein